jgi:hypothetical protein
MVATKVEVAGPAMILPKMKLTDIVITAETFGLNAAAGVLKGTLSKLKGTANNLSTNEDRLTFDADAVSISKGILSGEVAQGPTNFAWQALKATDFGATSNVVRMAASQRVIAKGPAVAAFAQISNAEIDGAIEWTKPAITNLAITIPDGQTKSLSISLAGSPEAIKIAGTLSVAAFGLSGLQVTRNLALAFAPSTSDATVAIPINISTPGLGGEIALSDYDQKYFLRANLADFRLKATLFLDLGDPVEGSRLEIQPNGLSAGLSSAVSLVPWLAGTKPGFGKVGVTIGNSEPVVIRKTNPTGNFDLGTDVLALAEPVMRIGEGAQQRRASLNLDAMGKAEFRYGVDERTLVTQKARFEAKDVDFRMLDSGGSVDIGGTLVAEPRITMKRLFIDLDRKNDVAAMTAEKVVVQGKTFSRTRTERTETAFNGSQASPFSIDKIVGKPEFNDTSITVREIDAENLSFGLINASLSLGESLVLRNATISLKADRIRSVDEAQKKDDGSDEKDDKGNVVRKRREYFTSIQVAANGKLKESEFSDAMQLDVSPTVSALNLQANGRSDMLDGSGGFHISPFSGLFRSNVEFQFACKGGKHPIAPTETRFSTGGSLDPLGVKIEKGAFAVEGVLAGLSLLYKGDTQAECDSESQKHVISPQQEWWTWGVCPTWSEPFRKCKWSTIVPEVSFSYHLRFGYYGMAGQALIAAPVLNIKDRETKFCFLPPVVFNPFTIAMGISPQLEFSGSRPGDVEKILNGLIHAALVPIESTLVTGLGNTAALAVGTILTMPEGAALACALIRKDIKL